MCCHITYKPCKVLFFYFTETLDGEIVAPTLGFSSVEFKLDKNEVTMFDLGGGKRIREVWKEYLPEIYGVIFVVDSSESHRMDESRVVLQSLLENSKVCGKPVLL